MFFMYIYGLVWFVWFEIEIQMCYMLDFFGFACFVLAIIAVNLVVFQFCMFVLIARFGNYQDQTARSGDRESR